MPVEHFGGNCFEALRKRKMEGNAGGEKEKSSTDGRFF